MRALQLQWLVNLPEYGVLKANWSLSCLFIFLLQKRERYQEERKEEQGEQEEMEEEKEEEKLRGTSAPGSAGVAMTTKTTTAATSIASRCWSMAAATSMASQGQGPSQTKCQQG